MKERINELDILRIFGFIMVVDQHILGSYAGKAEASFFDSMILNLLYLMGKPAVPMFVAITAITLFYTNLDSFNTRSFYLKRLSTVITPYIIWSVLSLIIFKKYSLLSKLPALLITGTASYHLWYMGMIIRVYMWFPLILFMTEAIIKQNRLVKYAVISVFSILYWLLLKNNNVVTHYAANLVFHTPTELQHRFFMYCPLFWSVYFVLGILIVFNYTDFKQFISSFKVHIILSYLLLLCYMYYTQICKKLPDAFPKFKYEHAFYILFMIATILVLYILAIYIWERFKAWNSIKKLINVLGNLSFCAYLCHVIILQKVAECQRSLLPIDSYLGSGLLIFAITVILSFLISYLLSLLPFSVYLTGIKRKVLPLSDVQSKKGTAAM